MAILTVKKGYNQGAKYVLKGDRIVLGRNADCQVVINTPAVSREHAVIRCIGGKFYIEDLKSRNGTFVNNQEVTSRHLLKNKDEIKICDNLYEFLETEKPPLPVELRRGVQPLEEDDDSSSTVEATFSHNSKFAIEAQPTERLTFLLRLTSELTQTLDLDQLLPKIVDSLFQVFRYADRGFIILGEPDRLVPKVSKTRRGEDDGTARFSRKIVQRCLETNEALLSEDASADKRFDLSQSIADCRIRSVMVAPLTGRTNNKAFGVIQLDTQDRARKFTPDDLKLLMAVASQAAVALENAELHQSLVAKAGLERDLKVAHQVQLSFLPKSSPQISGYSFAAHYEAAQDVGGDYYDFVPMPNNRLAVTIGDVAGKGVPAALLMAKVSSDARFCLLTEPTPADAVTRLNSLMQEAGELQKFVTLAACVIDTVKHEVTFVNAGHQPPILYRKATNTFEDAGPRDFGGLPLAVADGIPYESCTIPLYPGDAMVLMSDGVFEPPDIKGKEFGMERVYATLKNGPVEPEAMVKRLVEAVMKHTAGVAKQHDDITVVSFARKA